MRPDSKPPFHQHPALRVSTAPHPVNRSLADISPLSKCIDAWARFLIAEDGTHYPDRQRILDGLQHGVRIGYEGPRDNRPATPRADRNHVDEHSSDPAHVKFVSQEMEKEVALGRRAGPFTLPPFPNLIVSPLGVATKKHETKLRLVHDYSYPKTGKACSTSVNFHIPEKMRATILSSFDDAIDILAEVQSLSAASLHENPDFSPQLLKIDVKAAYRLIPIHPDDYHLLGMYWGGAYYVDLVAPFGLGSACQLWELIATALEWIFVQHLHITRIVHYVDDYLVICESLSLAHQRRADILAMCATLGVTISLEKLEGPTQVLKFLGIGIDVSKWVVFLDPARVTQVQFELDGFAKASHVSIHDLQCIAGLLNFCCKVIRQGRSFLRRIINYIAYLTKKVRSVLQPYPIANSVLLDIQWWQKHLPTFNYTTSIIPAAFPARKLGDPLYICTDACTNGFGAICGRHWLHGTWSHRHELDSRTNDSSERAKRDSMPFKEMLAIVIATATWGHLFRNQNITFLCDCEPVVFALNWGDSKRKNLMALIRLFASLAIQHQFSYQISHIDGVKNVFADALSRSDLARFHSLPCPHLYFRSSPCQPVIPSYSI
jgi:hypothetical protein